MPGSIGENRQYVSDKIQFMYDNKPNEMFKVLDVGPGYGTYGQMIQDLDLFYAITYCMEIWEPYIEEFELENIYDVVTCGDIRGYFDGDDTQMYDLVIFGDVLEHMTEEESIKVVEGAKRNSRWIIISVPIVHWPQGAEFGNPHEIHVQEHITPSDIDRMYGHPWTTRLGQQTGVFIYRNDN